VAGVLGSAPKGDIMREKARELGRQITEDVKPGGMGYDAVMRIGKLCD